jgi:hypothetical protein
MPTASEVYPAGRNSHNQRGPEGSIHDLSSPMASEKYTLSAEPLQSDKVRLNGIVLELGANDALPSLKVSPVLSEQSRCSQQQSRLSAFLELAMMLANRCGCAGPNSGVSKTS